MANNVLMLILLGLIALDVVFAIYNWQRSKQFKRKYNELLAGFTQANALLEPAQRTANEFLTACRLIAIDRNGRWIVFTFARGDKIFTFETMGLMSDNIQDWRKEAGLDQS